MKTFLLSLILATVVFTGCATKELNQNKASVEQTSNISADVNHLNEIQEQALHDAVRAKDMDQVVLLVENKSDLNTKDQYGYSPLHLSVRMDDYNITEYLIENGAIVNTTDSYGDTPLIDSTRDDYTQISKLLICNGAERKIEDKYKMTPLHYSAKNKNRLISEMLLAKDVFPYCNEDSKEPFLIEDETPNEDIAMEDMLMEEPMIIDELPMEDGPIIEIPVTLEESSKDEAPDEAPKEEMALSMIPEFKGLYEAMYEEFKNDLEPWSAELTQDDLLFRFNNPVALFEKGSNTLKSDFKDILADFFPRYLNVLLQYKDDIAQVRVEGHTSSEYSSATSEEQRYQLNKELSTKRAVNTRDYAIQIASLIPSLDVTWAENVFQAFGMSYDNLIMNLDGTENKEASRRVDFKIISK